MNMLIFCADYRHGQIDEKSCSGVQIEEFEI